MALPPLLCHRVLPCLISSNRRLVSSRSGSLLGSRSVCSVDHYKCLRSSGAGFSFSSTSEAIADDSHDSDADIHFAATKYITPKREKEWSKWVDRLYEYRNEHGDCSITKDTCDDEHLFSWVENQRHQFKLYKEGKSSRMTPERIRQLEEVGFAWSLHEVRWDEQYDKYCQYIRENGSDSTLPENDPLRAWAQRQRRMFREGGDLDGTVLSPMLRERREKLDSIGFVFDVRATTWMEKYELLKEYWINHGNCLVPPGVPVLGKWVDDQRQRYKKRQSGVKSGLTDERLQLLESVGFEWNALDAKWAEKMSELRQFVLAHGHCRVPFNYKHNPPLSRWLRHQRRLYKKHEDGQKTPLTEERIASLMEVGFLDGWNRKG